jgi:ubiquinone/menaquinone biosynthesis C-methylase UbiE
MEKIKEHLQWWENNLSSPQTQKDFEGWLETSDLESRNGLFSIIINKKIMNVLEIGPGTFIDYNIFFSKEENIKYKSIDVTKKIVDNAKNLGIDCTHSSIEEIKFPESEFDFVYCRHVFEHLDYYTIALDEMVRVSKKYIAVIFWLINENEEDLINYDSNAKLYHNSYSKIKIEKYLIEKKLKFTWINSDKDTILLIEK